MKLTSSKIVTVAVAFLLLAGCTTQSTQGPIKIGMTAPLSGPVSIYGNWAVQGAQLAVEDINENGRIDGRNVSLIVEDDNCDSEEGTTTTRKLLNVDNVNKIIVFCGAVTPAAAPITQGEALTYSISVRTDPLLGKYPHLFNMPSSVQKEMNRLADRMRSDGVENAVVLHQADPFGKTYQNRFVQAFEQRGGNVVLSESFSKYGDENLQTALTKARRTNATAIMTSFNPPNLVSLVQQTDQLGMNMSFYGPWLMQTGLLTERVGARANGMTYTYPFKLDATPKAQRFAQRYERAYNETPEMMAAFSYDAVQLMAKIGEACDSNLTCMQRRSNQVADYNGVSGTFGFNDAGVTTRNVYIKQIRNGTFTVDENT